MNEKRILIVDDDPSIRKFMNVNLEARGYLVSMAANGLDALKILRDTPVDLVLLDIMMPEMDGFQTCREIRKTWQTPIIMLSAREGEADGENSRECQANDYVTKPFQLRELLNKIGKLV